jgi:hypothetical protein
MRFTDNPSSVGEAEYTLIVLLVLGYIFYINRKSIKEYVIKNFEKFTLFYGYILVIGISLLLLGFVSTYGIVKEGFEIIFSGLYWFYQKLVFYLQFVAAIILYLFSIVALWWASSDIIMKFINLKKRLGKK